MVKNPTSIDRPISPATLFVIFEEEEEQCNNKINPTSKKTQSLLTKIQAGHCLEGSQIAATWIDPRNDFFIQHAALNLFEALFLQGESLDSAYDILKKAEKNKVLPVENNRFRRLYRAEQACEKVIMASLQEKLLSAEIRLLHEIDVSPLPSILFPALTQLVKDYLNHSFRACKTTSQFIEQENDLDLENF